MQKEWYEIKGGQRLEGTVTISGAKNAAVAIIPAAVLAAETCVLENLPHIQDVQSLKEILEELGVTVDYTAGDCMRIDSRTLTNTKALSEAVSSMRASYYLLGALLGRFHEVELALPGGCVIGARPIDQHIKGMRALGAEVELDCDRNIVRAKADRLIGAEIYFDVVSVGATINVMLAACMAEGNTILSNVAKEPHVVDVANFLNMMGASVKGAGTDVIRISGRPKLHGCGYAIIPDQIETGTFMIAAAATMGDVIIKNIIPTHMEAVCAKLMESGARVIGGDDGRDFFIRVIMNERPRAINVKTLPYPGFPTDLQQPMMAYLCSSGGVSTINETIFENRFNHVRELRRMGASISIKDNNTAKVKGIPSLRGADIYATDLRAGASLIVAGLAATGTTNVHNIQFIDRGYEYLDKKLKALGAEITRKEK
ncbi:MAG: UDP-N-acetylglucosamine 1-carboxyvinyltransferase [Firmicutes bacterium HGW-Firmicutes-9]|jgi:UDP-N-acetylglucosamine 1-carboxyvinyltransferase|nr:MAG: UDP-N-acetylglucosamine 1-carboxyvinyltransferase [Firmicutes bacterium HGW-Firmicutes-9]